MFENSIHRVHIASFSDRILSLETKEIPIAVLQLLHELSEQSQPYSPWSSRTLFI